MADFSCLVVFTDFRDFCFTQHPWRARPGGADSAGAHPGGHACRPLRARSYLVETAWRSRCLPKRSRRSGNVHTSSIECFTATRRCFAKRCPRLPRSPSGSEGLRALAVSKSPNRGDRPVYINHRPRHKTRRPNKTKQKTSIWYVFSRCFFFERSSMGRAP